MRSLRSGVAAAAIVAMWSSAAFGFNLFGSSDDSDKKPKPQPQTQTQPQAAQPQDAAEQPSIAKSLAANLDAEIEKAKTQRALGDLGGAAHALAQMMLVAPDDARVVSEYGKVLVQLGRSDDAIAFLKRGIELSPNDWTLYSAIGAAFDQQSKFADAQTAYQRGLQIKPDSAALLNNYAMSRMLAGDLPGAQALIARAQSVGNDPKIAHNATLMANLRNGPEAAAVHPVTTSVMPASPVTSQAALPKAVASAPLAPATQPQVKQAVVPPAPATIVARPATVKAASASAVQPAPVKAAAVAKPEAVKTAVAPVAKPEPMKAAAVVVPAPIKTAAVPAAEKPVIVKTETGRVMMQAIPKDPEAGPVKTDVAQTTKPETNTQEAKAEASAPPRTLASAAPAAAHNTPDLRAAAD